MAFVKYAVRDVKSDPEWYETLVANYRANKTTAPQKKTVERLLDYLTDEVFEQWVKEQTEEVARSTAEARCVIAELKKERDTLHEEVADVRAEIKAITEQRESIGADDSNVLKLVNLYSTFINVGKKAEADGNTAVREAAYLMWAYMTGGTTVSAEIMKAPEEGRE